MTYEEIKIKVLKTIEKIFIILRRKKSIAFDKINYNFNKNNEVFDNKLYSINSKKIYMTNEFTFCFNNYIKDLLNLCDSFSFDKNISISQLLIIYKDVIV